MSKSIPYKYIAIEGNIGAGKTSLAHIISHKFNMDLSIEEFAENTFLPQFYNNPERFAFPLEMSFLAERYQQLQQQQELTFGQNKILVSDYIFEKSLLFANVNLEGQEIELFKKFYHLIQGTLIQPDLILFLNKDTDLLLKNIAKRGRSYEQNIPDTYLEKVTNQYLNYLRNKKEQSVIIVDTNEIDFVESPTHLRFLLDLLQQEHPKIVQEIKY